MRGAIPPLPQYVFMVWCLVKHRDNFTLMMMMMMMMMWWWWWWWWWWYEMQVVVWCELEE
jgi:hypothetical protein